MLDPDNDQWSDWETVNSEYNQTILAYVTQEDEELAPEDVRLEGLVDMLPFLQIGDYDGAHYAPLIPAEKLAMPEHPARAMMGGYGMQLPNEGGMMPGAYGGSRLHDGHEIQRRRHDERGRRTA